MTHAHATLSRPNETCRSRTLHPGDVVCATRGNRLETPVGSCVAIGLTDPRRTVAAVCRIVHAGAARPGAPRAAEYAWDALAEMHARLQDEGTRVVGSDVGGTAYRRLAWTVGDAVPVVTATPIQACGRTS